MKTGLTLEPVKRWMSNKKNRANNTKKQIPNYFIQKHPEYSQHVAMVSMRRELLCKPKRKQLGDALQCLNTIEKTSENLLIALSVGCIKLCIIVEIHIILL
jgi:hypothetical protein